MGGHPVRPRVIGALEDRFTGRRVTAEALIKATGLGREQITAVMLALSRTEGSGVVSVTRGVWDYKIGLPEQRQESPDTIFEKVGVSMNGDLLVRGDETGRIYKVVAI